MSLMWERALTSGQSRSLKPTLSMPRTGKRDNPCKLFTYIYTQYTHDTHVGVWRDVHVRMIDFEPKALMHAPPKPRPPDMLRIYMYLGWTRHTYMYSVHAEEASPTTETEGLLHLAIANSENLKHCTTKTGLIIIWSLHIIKLLHVHVHVKVHQWQWSSTPFAICI